MNSYGLRHQTSRTFLLFVVAPVLLISMLAPIAILADEPVAAVDNTNSTGRRIAVIIVGHPGDSDHAALFKSSLEKIRTGLESHYGFHADDIHVFSGEPDEENSPDAATPDKPATRDSIAAELLTLKTGISADDSVFVIVMGHTHFENNLAWLNLPGPDLQQKEFAELFQGFQAKEQVFIITIPCSGYYIRNLSGPGRYIISATEADLEVNETLSPHALADLISAEPNPEWDLDKDQKFSLFEFYIALCQNVATRYSDETLIATEHGLLDDNGDGRGTELQMHFLSEEQGGLPKNRQRQTLTEGRDGMSSSGLQLTEFPK